jgi:hypothetical protein
MARAAQQSRSHAQSHHPKTTRTNNQTAAANSAPFNQVEILCPQSNAPTSPATRQTSISGNNQNQAHKTAAKTAAITPAEILSLRNKNPTPATSAPAATYEK